MILVVILVLIVIVMADVMCAVIVKRHFMPVSIVTVEFIANGVGAPIRMSFFPVMKACHANGIEWQPDITGAQIIVLAADNTYKFDTVPDITVRNRRLHRYCRRRRHLHRYYGCRDL